VFAFVLLVTRPQQKEKIPKLMLPTLTLITVAFNMATKSIKETVYLRDNCLPETELNKQYLYHLNNGKIHSEIVIQKSR